MTDRRLLTIADMLPDGLDKVADIGTDHGKLGAYLLETDKCKKVWFSDISAPSLEKARELVEILGLGARAECFVGDGALPLPGRPDAAVIAGMGGKTICSIIEAGREQLSQAFLVLQPNVAICETRTCLMNSGYRIADETVCREAGRMYVVIAARPGSVAYSAEELLAGPVLMHKRDELTIAYARWRYRIISKAIAGMRSAGISDTTQEETEKAVWESFM